MFWNWIKASGIVFFISLEILLALLTKDVLDSWFPDILCGFCVESGSQITAKTRNNRDDEFKVDEEVPLFLYTCNTCKPSLLLESSTSVPGIYRTLKKQYFFTSFVQDSYTCNHMAFECKYDAQRGSLGTLLDLIVIPFFSIQFWRFKISCPFSQSLNLFNYW